MKIKQLYLRTDAQRKFAAKYVKIKTMKAGYTKEGFAFIAAKTQSTHRLDNNGFFVPVPASKRETYVTAIVFTDAKLNVKCACSCPDYLYREEVALWTHKAADIYYSNGEFPGVTNPQLRPYICKHLCALYVKAAPQIPNEGG